MTDIQSKFQSYRAACLQQLQELLPEPLEDMALAQDLKQQLQHLVICSQFALRVIRQQGPWFLDALQQGFFAENGSREYYSQQLEEIFKLPTVEIANELRLFRHREMLRICWRDINGMMSLDETMMALSHLADCVIEQALKHATGQLYATYGTPVNEQNEPQQMIVLAMGKLGAYELNFSSDIDLIFVYPQTGRTIHGKRSISNNEFFIKLGQQLIQLIDQCNAYGFVFRVDMRLRPFGKSGPLAVSINAMEDYYAVHGREWERYALIKARMIGGQEKYRQQLQQILHAFVYRRYIDFGVFEALREMKSLIAQQVKQKSLQDHIKLGAGGIREIEFIAQAFQLLRGGRDPELQQRQVQIILKLLVKKKSITAFISQNLLDAYHFLRLTEHRLQQFDDQQTHLLPTDDVARERLACAMGFSNWQAFEEKLQFHRQQVDRHFNQLFTAPQKSGTTMVDGKLAEPMVFMWQTLLQPEYEEMSLAILKASGFDKASEVYAMLKDFKQVPACQHHSSVASQRLDTLMPLLLKAVVCYPRAQQTLGRILDIITTICRRSVYIALLVENPLALSQLVRLCAASSWISHGISRYPALLDELLDPRMLYRPMKLDDLRQDLRLRLSAIDMEDLEQQMEVLRYFKLAHVLRVAAADITDAIKITETSSYLTWIAQAILEQVFNIAWQQTRRKLGVPQLKLPDKKDSGHKATDERHFAIVGFGKLGGIELGYGSDLDLVFVYDDAYTGGQTRVIKDGQKSVDNILFFTRLGQRIMHILGTNSYCGILYECDMRLRPNGNSGQIATSLGAFRKYELEKAWLWEHQALCRARVVCGNSSIQQQFQQIRSQVLTQPRESQWLQQQIREMRSKMRLNLEKKVAGKFDVKQGAGGIVDIEFMVQYLILAHAARYPDIVAYSDNLRMIEKLTKQHLMETTMAGNMIRIYRQYRGFMHRQALQDSKPLADDSLFASQRQQIQQYWQSLMENNP